MGVGGGEAGLRLVAAARQRQAARLLFPGDDAMRVCPETVYRWIYSGKPRRERRARCLPRGHRRRKHAGRRVSRFPIPGRVSIAERPPEADDRSGFGHWEADSVIGMGCDLHTEVERRARFLMARVIPDKTAERSVGAQLAMFAPLPAAARLSVTHDNGTGFARHARLRGELGMARELQEIVDETDNRPMRALGYRTPAEAFADELPDLQL